MSAGRSTLFGCALAAIVCPAVVLAMLVPLSLAELAAQSDLVVVGEVTELQSKWNEDRTTIYTHVTLTVQQVVLSRGTADPDQIVFQVEGGVIGEQEVRTSVSPEFQRGAQGVFFLSDGTDRETMELVGAAQGFIPIENGWVNFAGDRQPLNEFLSRIERR